MADELNERSLAGIEAALEGCPSTEFRTRLRRSLQRRILMSTVESTMTRAEGVRPGFTAVTPYVMTPDVERVIAFAKQTFGAEEVHRATGSAGGIHAELRIGDSMLMFGGGTPSGAGHPSLAPRLVGLHVYVDDADAVYQRALDAGAESLGAPEDRHYGERAGFVKDPAGNHWYIATHTGPTYFAEGPRTVTPNLYVQRAPAKGGSEFIDFMKAALGARVEMRVDAPDGTLRHAIVRIADAAIEIGEGSDPGRAAPAAFILYVPDCDALYQQAVEAGGKSLHPPIDQPYGDRMGGVVDPWGNEWFIATHVGGGVA